VRVGLIIMGVMIIYEHIRPGVTQNWIRKEMNKNPGDHSRVHRSIRRRRCWRRLGASWHTSLDSGGR
jgi:hypothetical protein